MVKIELKEIVSNHDSRRKALNAVERRNKKTNPQYPYYGANGIVDFIDEYIFDEELLCIAEDGGNWGYKQNCSYIVNGKYWVNNHVHVLKPKKNVEIKYLMYYLNYTDLTSYITGTTRGKLTRTALDKIQINLPELEIQREIIIILDKINNLIKKSKKRIIYLEELVKSRFIEMFGDFENSTPIGDVCTIKARIGWQGLSKKEYLLSGEYRLITGVDFNNGRINFENCYYINKERYEQDDNIKIKMGDVLVTKDGTIGKVAIVDKLDIPATLNSGVFVLRNKDNTLNNVFLVYSLLSEDFKRFIENIKIGATVPHLNQSSFVKHKIKLPPLYLQEEFSQFVEKTDKLKFEAEKSLKEMENLYESLMQKFFKQN